MFRHIILVCAALVFSVEAAAFSPCYTSTNGVHLTGKRATKYTGSQGNGYYAVGTSDFMGGQSTAVVSLTEISGVVESVINYYRPYGYTPVDFIYVSSTTYGVVLKYKNTTTKITVKINATKWRAGTCDMDGDGMADDWEVKNFGNLKKGANDDSDGDGANNYIEFLMGTVPTSAGSIPENGDYFEYDALGRIKSIRRLN